MPINSFSERVYKHLPENGTGKIDTASWNLLQVFYMISDYIS